MIDWSTICVFLREVIAAIAELPLVQVTWRDQKQPYNPSALVKLHNTAERSLGSDLEVFEGDDLVLYGWRAWTLNIQVEAVSQEFDAWAPTYASRIRTRFQRQSTRARLRKVGISIMQDFPSVDVTLDDDGRVWSKTQDSYEMNAVIRDVDSSLLAGNWIERVRVVGTLDGRIETDQTIALGREFDRGFDAGFLKTAPRIL